MAVQPQSSYRATVGLAKDTINATLTSAVNAAGTSLPLSNTVGTTGTLTTGGATYSAIIVDGPLTETVACTGNFTAGAIACAALANAHSANAYVTFQLTASIGPTVSIRVTKPDFSDAYAQLYDKGYRGSLAEEYGSQQGMRNAKFSLDGDLFADEFGYLAAMFFGAYDYTATSGGNPTTYAFSPLNTGNGQPTPYLVYWFDPGANQTYVLAKAVLSDLTCKFDDASLAGWTASGMAYAMGPVANWTASYSNFTPVASWHSTATIGGTANIDVQTAEFAFKRNEFGEVNTLQGIQDPLAIFGGTVNLTTKFTMVQADATQYQNYVNNSQPSFDIKCIQGTGTAQNGIEIHCNKANYTDAKPVVTGKAYVVLDASFMGLATTSDATTAGGGYSPAKLTTSTGTTTGSTLY